MRARPSRPGAAALAAGVGPALVVAALLACAGGAGPDAATDAATDAAAQTGPGLTVLLVRHAEKDLTTTPTNLDRALGLPRAQALVAIAREARVTAVYSTEFCRTAQTAQPTALALGLPLRLLRERGLGDDLDLCAPRIEAPTEAVEDAFAPPALAARLRAEHPGQAVLVVGHSNTVPAVVEALGARALCPGIASRNPAGDCELPEERFGDLIVVRAAAAGTAQLETSSYGSPAPGAPLP